MMRSPDAPAPAIWWVTQDIPLAARVLECGAQAVSPRDELFTPDTIAERLSMRDFMDEVRGAAYGPAALRPCMPATGRPSRITSTPGGRARLTAAHGDVLHSNVQFRKRQIGKPRKMAR